jgi:regulatory protein
MDKTYVIGGVKELPSRVTIEVICPSGDVKKLSMTPKMWEGYHLASADTVSADIYRMLTADSERCEAVTKALRALTASTLSYGALNAKLKQSGFSEDAVRAAVAIVRKRGLIDEESDASAIAEKMARTKGRGPARIKAELQKKGYSSSVASTAAYSVPQEIYEEALKKSLHAKCKGRVPEDKAERDKLTASLVRLGFSPSVIFSAMEEAEE